MYNPLDLLINTNQVFICIVKTKFLYLYYFVLILVLAFYTNMSSSPNIIIRFGYLAALVFPLLKKVELFPAVIICALGISKNTFAFPFMPTEMYYYVALALGFALLSLYRQDYRAGIIPFFVIALVYVAINDIFMQGKPSQMASTFLICISFYICMEDVTEVDDQFLSLSFILISLTISYWALFCPDAQINNYNKVEDMEQTGWTDPNYLSIALGTGLVIAIKDLVKGSNKPFYTMILTLTVLASTIAMLQLASRGAILAVVSAATILLVFSKSPSWIKITIIILMALFVVYLYTNDYMEFVMARIESDDGTANKRTLIWHSKLDDFFRDGNLLNWIFGIGQSRGVEIGEYYGKGRSTHNDFLSVLIYYGIIGVIIFFSAIAYPLRICQKSERPQITALLVYLLMCSMTIEPLAFGNIAYWGFFFYIIVLARQSQEMKFIEIVDDEENEEQN